MTFDATAGQVTFALANGGSAPVTIVQGFGQGAGITGVASTTLTTANIVPSGGTLTLTVTFPGVTFQPGQIYYFKLTSTCGGLALIGQANT